ncbi:hypothetical protein J6590_070644 [Homalodisca vitripennis]|nr:hypothetical protein J6590_070644 [Homalodisca vitripennis]
MTTLSPSPLITSPGNIVTADVSQYSALPSSPLISQLICAKKKYSVECQTEDMHLKTKDELVDRISELTSREDGLVDKIQELTRQLEEAKNELNRHRASNVFKCDSSIQTEFKSSDKSLQTENEEDCVQCKILQEEAERMISTIRTMEEGVLVAKENPQYPEFLEIKNRFTVLSEEEESEFFPSNLQKVTRKGKNYYSRKNTIQRSIGFGSGSIRHESRSYSSTKKNTIELVDVYGDSHAKNLTNKLCKHLNRHSDKDAVFIMAGFNDVSTINEDSRSPGKSVVDQLTWFVKTNRHTNFVMVNLFHRHDLPPNGLINREIKRINENLNILKQERVPIVDVSTFSRKLFTRHGQHLNGLGKNILCEEMRRWVGDCLPRVFRFVVGVWD